VDSISMTELTPQPSLELSNFVKCPSS